MATRAAENRRPGFSITEMTIADYDAVSRLLHATPGIRLRSADSREATARFLVRNPGLSFVARSDGRIVGCVMSGHDGRRGYLYHLAVAQDFRRRGAASRLVACCLEKLAEAGIGKTHVQVLTANDIAHEFWTNQGWQRRSDIITYSVTAPSRADA